MLEFNLYDSSGRPASSDMIRHAHAVGPDDLPLQATFTRGPTSLRVERPSSDSTALCVQLAVPCPDAATLEREGAAPLSTAPEFSGHLGVLTLQTALLPQRTEPYLLGLELARRHIMLFLNKLEDWGLFDHPGCEPILRQFEAARRTFTEALVASRRRGVVAGGEGDITWQGEADRLAMVALAIIIDAGDRLAVLDARRSMPERLSGKAYQDAVKIYTRATAETPSPGAAVSIASVTGVTLPGTASIGVPVEPLVFNDAIQKAILSFADFITVPMRWVDMEPVEGKYSFAGSDRWIEWAVRTAKLPVIAGPVLDLRPQNVPEWLYIWENDYETLRDVVIEHIQQIVTRYRRAVHRWTIASGLNVNGNIKLSIEQVIDLSRTAIAAVRKLHPGAKIQLAVDEPWGEYHATRKRSLPPLIYTDAMMQIGTAVDTIGLRLVMGHAASGRSTRDLLSLSALLDRYALFNRPIAITGLGVPSRLATPSSGVPGDEPSDLGGVEPEFDGGWWRCAWSEGWQADWASQVLAILASKPYIQSVCWNQLLDGLSGGISASLEADLPSGGLVSTQAQLKPIVSRLGQIRQAIKNGGATTGAGCDAIPGLGVL